LHSKAEKFPKEKELHKIEIFKTGTHKPMKGDPRSFSVSDLDTIVAKNVGREVPLVVGHPKIDDPAYGWAKSFSREGDILFAEIIEIDPEFEELVKAGKYKNVSIYLNPDNTLRHIGFLGAVPPAVKGLKSVTFSESDEGDCFGDLKEELENPVNASVPINELETSVTGSIGVIVDETIMRIKELEKQVEELLAEKREKLASEKKAEFAAFADMQVSEGRIKPDQKQKVVSVLEYLHTNSSGSLAFADQEPEGSKAFKELIGNLPRAITPGRIVGLQFAQGEEPKPAKPLEGKELAQFITNQMETENEA
jgi:hypothetical protein